MLCYRCGSHVEESADQCWNCAGDLSQRKKASDGERWARQRTGTRLLGVVYKVGDLIADRYRVKDIVGSGGAGIVYRAVDGEVDVAVKVINGKLVQTADERRLLARQTKIAKKLTHQNCVRIFDDGVDGDQPFFAMQFLDGLSLRRIIDLRREKGQVFTPEEIEPIFNQLCQAIAYAHQTTFHGNLKPDNVLVLPDLLKITDFSLLRGLPRKPFLALQKSRGPNFHYLAPEVRFEVAEIDKAVDVYSLGVIVTEMLTGLVVDDAKWGDTERALEQLDPEFAALIKACLSRAPNERPASVDDLYRGLKAAIAAGATGAPRAAALAPASVGAAEVAASEEVAASAEVGRLAEATPGADPVEASGPKKTHDAPTERLDVDRHGPRPIADEDLHKEPSLALLIEDYMIESESSDRSRRALAAEFDVDRAASEDEGLIDDPRAAPSDLSDEEEETVALEEPDEDVQAARARLENEAPASGAGDGTSAGAVVRSGSLEEISNSAIELIDDPKVMAGASRPPDFEAEDAIRDGERSSGAPIRVIVGAPSEPAPVAGDAPEVLSLGPLARPQNRSSFRTDLASEGPATGSPPPDGGRGPRPRLPSFHAVPSRAPAAPVAFGEEGTVSADRDDAGDAFARPSAAPPSKERPMTRPRPATISPVAAAVTGDPLPPPPKADTTRPVVPMQPPAPVPPAPAGSGASARLVYFTVAASFVLILIAFAVVLKITSDQQRRNRAEIAALRAQIEAQTAAANQARAKEQAALQEVQRHAAAEREAERAAESAAAARARSEEAGEKAEKEARASEAAATALRARAAGARTARARKESESRARRAAGEARRQRAHAEAERDRMQTEQEATRAAEAARDREQQARLEAEQRAFVARDRARRAEVEAERLREQQQRDRAPKVASVGSRIPIIPGTRTAEEASDPTPRSAARAGAETSGPADRPAPSLPPRSPIAPGGGPGPADGPVDDAARSVVGAQLGDDPGRPKCPQGMVLVDGGPFMMGSLPDDPERNFGDLPYASVEVPPVCIDAFEYPNGRGRAPASKVTWKAAVARCERRGKRLCSEAEWEKACKGPGGYRYAYGNRWNPERCNTEDEEGHNRSAVKSGSFPQCRSRFGALDMAGNVAEWTSTAQGSRYVVKGGRADRPGFDSRCAARSRKKASYSSELLGFRCCKDPD